MSGMSCLATRQINLLVPFGPSPTLSVRTCESTMVVNLAGSVTTYIMCVWVDTLLAAGDQ